MAVISNSNRVNRRTVLAADICSAAPVANGCPIFVSGSGGADGGGEGQKGPAVTTGTTAEIFTRPCDEYPRTRLDAGLPVHADAL